jgi:D-3-phosphoglycerate dehydrogenase
MRKGAYFINTSRGGVVDEAALKRAVQEQGIRAGLDVYATEPSTGTGTFEDDIVDLEGVYGTHHIGASTQQAQEAIADETLRILQVYRDTGHVPNVVNLCERSPATHALVVRHADRVGVLAHVLNGLRSAGINVQEMENVVFSGAEAAMARIHLDRAPENGVLDQLRSGRSDIYELDLINLSE